MQTPINNSAIFRTSILVLLWITQLLIEIILMGAYATAVAQLNFLNANQESLDDTNGAGIWVNLRFNQDAINGALAFAGAILGVVLLFILTHVIQIIMYARSRMTPVGYFSLELPRFVIWTVVFGLALATTSRGVWVEVIFVIIAWILYLFSLVYASFLFHGYRMGRYSGPEVVRNQTQSGSGVGMV